ncbi:MAG: GNAT family N-acetyltransferase [Flavobacteriaceae bacterium]|nr:GNAT family N-acetyltransferase [Flavobacteriaceae bacterium]
MQWTIKKYDKLTTNEFHNILQLRIEVFVVEQNCPYSELDGKDKIAYHFFAFAEENPDQIIAYTRIFKPGDYYKKAAIGRVVVHPNFRKDGLGYELMVKSISQIKKLFNTDEIKIGAQTYLRKFYNSLGFKKQGEDYIEDGIPHIYMIKK